MELIRRITWRPANETYGYSFWCPGCEELHVFTTSGDKRWTFDGDMEKPTFTPSLRCLKGTPRKTTCHLNLTAGVLVFHNDSPHALAGQKIPLQEHPDA